MKKMNYSIAVFLLFALSCAGTVTKGARGIAALDDNRQTVLDPALESPYAVNEEELFAKVATTISEFVAKQYRIRTKSRSGGERDLPWSKEPGKGYATRDVHRK